MRFSIQTGGTPGVGGEYWLNRTWSIFAQYQHIWLEDGHFTMPAASPSFNYKFRNDLDIVTAGVTPLVLSEYYIRTY
jgi:hypothetical protein